MNSNTNFWCNLNNQEKIYLNSEFDQFATIIKIKIVFFQFIKNIKNIKKKEKK